LEENTIRLFHSSTLNCLNLKPFSLIYFGQMKKKCAKLERQKYKCHKLVKTINISNLFTNVGNEWKLIFFCKYEGLTLINKCVK